MPETNHVLFRCPLDFKPFDGLISLSSNSFFFGHAQWQGKELLLRKGLNTYYRLQFALHASSFYFLEQVHIEDNSLYALYANPEDLSELEAEFHKEVLAACLRELFPAPKEEDLLSMTATELLPQLAFLVQPVFFPFDGLLKIEQRTDFYLYPEFILTAIAARYRKFGVEGLLGLVKEGFRLFPENRELQLMHFFMHSFLGEKKSAKLPLALPGFFDCLGETGNPYRLRMEFLLEYYFSQDERKTALQLADQIHLDPHSPISVLDYLLSLLKADVWLNQKQDYKGVAEILRYLSFFGGNELLLYYQLLGCALARQGYLHEAERYKLKALGLKNKFPLVYHQLGRIAKKQGRIQDALRYFEEAISLERFLYESHSNKSNVRRNEAAELEYILCLAQVSYSKAYDAFDVYTYHFPRTKIPFDLIKIQNRLDRLYTKQRQESVAPLLKDICQAVEN